VKYDLDRYAESIGTASKETFNMEFVMRGIWKKRGLLATVAAMPVVYAMLANAATVETVISGNVSQNGALGGSDQDGLGLFPNLVDSSGNFTGVGTAFTFTYTWDSDVASPFYYSLPEADPVFGISTDSGGPNGVIKSIMLDVGGQQVNFGPDPSFYTLNSYETTQGSGLPSLQSLFRLDDNGSQLYFLAAGNPGQLPTKIGETFSLNDVKQGFPSFAFISLIDSLKRKTEFGFDISSISVSVLGGTSGTGGTGGVGGTGGGTGGGGTGSGTGGGTESGGGTGGIDLGGSGGGTEATDVPVPAALPLMASALAGFGFLSRKRRKAVASK
jgi:hypothetical protein